jgi:hypothetical protein
MAYVLVYRISLNNVLGEVRNVEIHGPAQQLLNGKSHNFLAIFALAHSKINHIA